VTLFELEAVGGPWARRLAARRALGGPIAWSELLAEVDADVRDRARAVWTQSAFSEYASAASFAAIATAGLAAGAPVDLVAACGDFVADEMLHAELSANVATALGGPVALEVDLERLVRPPLSDAPLLRMAELVVRTSCVGEALTVPVLKAAKATCGSPVLEAVIARIVRDESAHAELGWWFLDWAEPRLDEAARTCLARVAAHAITSLRTAVGVTCASPPAAGVLDCATFDPTFEAAVRDRVVHPLGERGIFPERATGEPP